MALQTSINMSDELVELIDKQRVTRDGPNLSRSEWMRRAARERLDRLGVEGNKWVNTTPPPPSRRRSRLVLSLLISDRPDAFAGIRRRRCRVFRVMLADSVSQTRIHPRSTRTSMSIQRRQPMS